MRIVLLCTGLPAMSNPPSATESRLVATSPAKINLTLSITGKRPDGFHDLVSLVAKLKWGDEISLCRDDTPGQDVLSSDCNDLPLGPENLILRAVDAFRSETHLPGFWRLHLTKRIPLAAGLGGGSSNAATTLRLLNQVVPEPLGLDRLSAIASELGSDVPLFLHEGPVVMRGRGEHLEPVEEALATRLQATPLLVFQPDFGVPTPWAYHALAETRDYSPPRIAEDRSMAWNDLARPWESLVHNDFEKVVFDKYSFYEVLQARFAQVGLPRFFLSGSGSACFWKIPSHEARHKACEWITEALGEHAFVVETEAR